MSSNKSQTLNLHLWVPEDDFLRAEFNENFTALDSAVKADRNSIKAEETARKNAVTAEANARKNAITQLQNSISSTGSTSTSAVNSLRTELMEQINAVKATADAAYCPDYKPFATGFTYRKSDATEDTIITLGFRPNLVVFITSSAVAAFWENGRTTDALSATFSNTGLAWRGGSTQWSNRTIVCIAFR